MSVVAVKVYEDKIEMAADSIIIAGSRKEMFYGGYAKINKINDMIIGASGTCEEIGLMWLYAKNHRPLEATERDVLEFFVEFVDWKSSKGASHSLENLYLIAINGKVFHIQNYMVLPVDKYSAIGAGADYSLAALYLGTSAEKAVKVACELSCYVAEPIITHTMDIKALN